MDARVTTNTESLKTATKRPLRRPPSTAPTMIVAATARGPGRRWASSTLPRKMPQRAAMAPTDKVESPADEHERHAHGNDPQYRYRGEHVLHVQHRTKSRLPDGEKREEKDHYGEHGTERPRARKDIGKSLLHTIDFILLSSLRLMRQASSRWPHSVGSLQRRSPGRR